MEKVCDAALKIYGISYVAAFTAIDVALTVAAIAWAKKIIAENFVNAKVADEKQAKKGG